MESNQTQLENHTIESQFLRYAAWHRQSSIERFIGNHNAYRLVMEGDAKQRPAFIEYDWHTKEIISFQKVLPPYPDRTPTSLLGQNCDAHNEFYVVLAKKIWYANRYNSEYGYDYMPPVFVICIDASDEMNPCNTRFEGFDPKDTKDVARFWVRRLYPFTKNIKVFLPKQWAEILVYQRGVWERAYRGSSNKEKSSGFEAWLKNEKGVYVK